MSDYSKFQSQEKVDIFLAASQGGITLPMWRITPYLWGGGSNTLTQANALNLLGVALPYYVQAKQFRFIATAGGGSQLYSFGLFSEDGNTRVAHSAPTAISSAAETVFAFVEGLITIQPGLYLFCWTGNGNTAEVNATGDYTEWAHTSAGTTSGGAQPATVSANLTSKGLGAGTGNVVPLIQLDSF